AGFAFERDPVPESMTRPRGVASTAPSALPLLVMDTAPAAALGAPEDALGQAATPAVAADLGKFHSRAVHLSHSGVAGLFEHHTGELSPQRLAHYVERLGTGAITNEEVFSDKGHGALVLEPDAPPPDLLAVTGPRRALMVQSGLEPYLAVPHGDMML